MVTAKIVEVALKMIANCNNTCPENMVIPNGSVSGTFLDKRIIEIKGCVGGVNDALFNICK